jgi:hypothetical protein
MQPDEYEVDHRTPAAVIPFRAETQPAPPWSGPAFDPWEEYVVPPFPLAALPRAVSEWVQDQARLTGGDSSALAMAALANFSGALDHQFRLRMMRNGSWAASPRLWVLLVGDPSMKKTPIINTALGHLEFRQKRRMDEHARALAEFKANKGKGGDDDEPKEPERYLVSDVTPEKLGEILSRSDRGILLKRDEVSGWIGAMEKYGSGRSGSADRGFWLEAYNGGPHSFDRIGRGSVPVGNLSVSIIGGIQPARLAEISGLTSDGLLQRFIPVMMTSARFPEDAPDGASVEAYRRLTDKLLAAKPQQLSMSDQALVTAEALRRELFEIEQASDGLEPGFQAFVGKAPGVFGSLTLILQMIENPDYGSTFPVELETVERAATIMREFIIPHGREFYRRSEADSDGGRLRRIASYILTSQRQRLSASDFTKNVASMRGLGVFEVAKWLSPLVAGGWLEPATQDPTCKAWNVRPDIFEQMKHRTRKEEARKATLARLMNSGRRPREDG